MSYKSNTTIINNNFDIIILKYVYNLNYYELYLLKHRSRFQIPKPLYIPALRLRSLKNGPRKTPNKHFDYNR